MSSVSERFSPFSDPEAFHANPTKVVADPALIPDEKHAVLRNWAWNEYLIDLATAEGMPENGRSTRLDEVEQALLALETRPVTALAFPVQSTITSREA